MTTFIPLPGNRLIGGYRRHKDWTEGDWFLWEGKQHQFLGRDHVKGLHARQFPSKRLCVFESDSEWQRITSPAYNPNTQ